MMEAVISESLFEKHKSSFELFLLLLLSQHIVKLHWKILLKSSHNQ